LPTKPQTPRPDDVIRVPEVARITGLGRTTIWKKSRDPKDPFPAAIPLTATTIGWIRCDVEAWLLDRKRLRSDRAA